MTDISPSQMQANAAKQKAARQIAIDNIRGLVNDLQVRIGNCERTPNDPVRAASLPELRNRLALAHGQLDAATRRDEELTRGYNPKSEEQQAADRALVLEREVKRNRERNAGKDWLSQAPGTAEVIAEREARRGPGRPRKVQA